jgi:prolyl oligopeptidase
MRTRSTLFVVLAAACGHSAPAPHAPPAEPAAEPAAATPPATPVAPPAAGPPAARTVDVVETIFGRQVADPYRWMEGSDNAETTAWLRAQGDYTRGYLARLPGRDKLYARIRELGLSTASSSDLQVAGGRAFYHHLAADAQLPTLAVRDQTGERVLVDPATLGKGDQHASLNAFAPSPDGSLVAYDIALGGGELSTLRVMDVKTGKDLPDAIERVWGEGAAQWLPDGKSFFYTQMLEPKEGVDPILNQQVKLHVLGTPADKDPIVLGSAVTKAPAIAANEWPSIWTTAGSPWLIASLGGARSESRIAVAPLAKLDRSGAGKTPWRVVAEYADDIEWAYPHGDRLYLVTYKGASNRKVISVPLAAPVLAKAKVELAESPDGKIERMNIGRDAAFVETMVSGTARLWRLPWKGKPALVTLPFDGWIDEVAADPLADGATFNLQGWVQPSAYYAVDGKSAVAPTGVGTTTSADYSTIVADEVEATSADGTKVPLSIVHGKDLARDGSHPAYLFGYAGYGISMTPRFEPTTLAWLERGGVYAVCHGRGGGEKGHRWQEDGTHEHKMNGVHDFEACGQYLIDQKWTTGARLGARAGSMGGILIGRAITERPDLFAAANVAVGIVNPVRLLAAENGANQKAELGDPETEAGFTSIFEMDPYHHVAPHTAYPSVIFTVGLNDKRVAPWMTAKMAARMQAATTSGKPVLVRIDADAGHGIGSTRDQTFAERADVWSFFLAAAGDAAFQPR